MRSRVASTAIGSITGSPLVRKLTLVAEPDCSACSLTASASRRSAAGRRLLVERRGSELADEAARLAEVLGGGLPREPELLAGALVVDVALGGVQQHLDAREALRHRVVDLAREALALGERAGLAARGRELLAGREQVEDEGLPVAGLLRHGPVAEPDHDRDPCADERTEDRADLESEMGRRAPDRRPKVITTSGTAIGASSTCSSRKKRGNARNAASGVRNDIASHRREQRHQPRHAAQVGKWRCAAATPAPYQARNATARIVTGHLGRRVGEQRSHDHEEREPDDEQVQSQPEGQEDRAQGGWRHARVGLVDHGHGGSSVAPAPATRHPSKVGTEVMGESSGCPLEPPILRCPLPPTPR